MLIKQVYIDYRKWDCYQNGMYFNPSKIKDTDLDKAISFMSDTESFGLAMEGVSLNWKNSMINFLTNDSINQKSFIGQCAVFYELGIQEKITRTAWKEIGHKNRHLANLQALKYINLWKIKYLNTLMIGKKSAITTGYQMKFPWY
jgi:hypothetical protein